MTETKTDYKTETDLDTLRATIELQAGEIARLKAAIEAQGAEIKRLNDGWASSFTALEIVYRAAMQATPFKPTGQGNG